MEQLLKGRTLVLLLHNSQGRLILAITIFHEINTSRKYRSHCKADIIKLVNTYINRFCFNQSSYCIRKTDICFSISPGFENNTESILIWNGIGFYPLITQHRHVSPSLPFFEKDVVGSMKIWDTVTIPAIGIKIVIGALLNRVDNFHVCEFREGLP